MINVERINELARKQKTGGLTEEEKEERFKLRQEYRKAFIEDLKQSLNNIEFVDDKSENNKK